MSASERSKLLVLFHAKKKERANTPKQEAFVEGVKRTGDPVAAALEVYDTDDKGTATKLAKRNMSKASIREEVEGCMEEAGLETINVMKALGEALRATKPDVITDKNFIEGGPDHRIRLDAAKEALKLKGAYPKEDAAQHLHLHAHMVEQLSQLPFDELTSMMKAEVMTERLLSKKGAEQSQEILLETP